MDPNENHQKGVISNLVETMVLVVFSSNLTTFEYYRSEYQDFQMEKLLISNCMTFCKVRKIQKHLHDSYYILTSSLWRHYCNIIVTSLWRHFCDIIVTSGDVIIILIGRHRLWFKYHPKFMVFKPTGTYYSLDS